MRILKSHPLLKLVNSYVIDSPQPSNISYLWNFGSLLALCLIIQIITGVTLGMHYTPNVLEAFDSVEHIMRDVNNGWLIRYLHSNTASAFFFLVYLHIGRGLYYGSYKAPRTLTWTIGTVIFILMMATAFLGYVLPYGQMSLWGATVITNLMSAIPWVGQDIVESSKFSLGVIFIVNISLFYFFFKNTGLLELIKQNNNDLILPPIGVVDKNALKNSNKSLKLNKKQYISIPSSFLAFLVGIIDGNGYILISKSPKGFISIKLIISLHKDDISILEYIKSILRIGYIKVYRDLKNPTCKLIINKTELQEILYPLLVYNKIFFLIRNRSNRFNLCMFILENDIKKYDEIYTKNIPFVYPIPKKAKDYTSLHFFKNWIVGFTCTQGSFFFKANNEGYFQIKQKTQIELFQAFNLIFKTNRKINLTNNSSKFGVSSKNDIQIVIKIFSFSGLHPLIGLKYIQYMKWLKLLRESTIYNKLIFP